MKTLIAPTVTVLTVVAVNRDSPAMENPVKVFLKLCNRVFLKNVSLIARFGTRFLHGIFFLLKQISTSVLQNPACVT